MQRSPFIKIILLCASTMTVMAGAIISPALPDIDRHFPEQPEVMIQLILTMPALMITLFGAPLGFVADRFGRTRLLMSALAAYGLAGFAGFLVDDFYILLLSRALLGIAVAGIMSVSTTLIGDYFEADERTRFLGTQGSFMAMGGIVFLNLGGVLAEWSWRGPFLVYLVGLVLAPLAWRILYEPSHHDEGGEGDDRPVGPQRIDWLSTGVAFALGFTGMTLFYMIPAQLPFLLFSRDGASSTVIGAVISLATLTSAFISFNYGRIKHHLTVIQIYCAAHLCIALGFALIGLANDLVMTAVGVGLSGLGFGFTIPNGNVWIMTITPAKARGRIVGGFSSMIFLGQFLSPLLVAPLVIMVGSLQQVYLAAGLFSALLIPLLWTLNKRSP